MQRTVKLLHDWAAVASKLKIVRIFAGDVEKVAILNLELAHQFGWAANPSAVALLLVACAELNQKISAFSDADTVQELRTLVRLGTAPNPAAFAVAVKGRTVAETCACRLFKHVKPTAPFPGKLSGLINEVELFIKSKKQDWILNYFHLLRNVGNNEAHASTSGVNITDAAAVVVAAIRVAEFTEQAAPASS